MTITAYHVWFMIRKTNKRLRVILRLHKERETDREAIRKTVEKYRKASKYFYVVGVCKADDGSKVYRSVIQKQAL